MFSFFGHRACEVLPPRFISVQFSGSVVSNLMNRSTPVLPAAAFAKSLQSCPTLCDPIDGLPPSSPVPGILQARTLEWVAISFSKEKGKYLLR